MRAAIHKALERHQLSVDDDAIDRLTRWANAARTHGKRTNLIGSFDVDRIAEEFVADSLQLLPLLDEQSWHIVDVGSGAGIPGLILHGALAHHTSLLIEPRAKRAMFLRHASRAMNLAQHTEIIDARLEDIPAPALQSDLPRLWVSRAVFAPQQWVDVVSQHAVTGDACAVWMNGHLDPEQLFASNTTWHSIGHRTYTIPGPGDRTVALLRFAG